MIGEVADLLPDWNLILIGPVVKIRDEDLPKRSNLHYFGGRTYDELPDYLRGWQVAIMPFAINEATRFISPTKTSEYLAAGLPVVSTAIPDVVVPYGVAGLVQIAVTQNSLQMQLKPRGRKILNPAHTSDTVSRKKFMERYL